ncbi:MAG: O-antigen ligase family protein [Candidatus Promineifilaceae bacterium]|nr:O-antigen ligase family protein [Candidatus Promineifilaceae bacterium]
MQIADFLIGPYIIMVLVSVMKIKKHEKILAGQLIPLMLIFLWWTLTVTLLIPFRFNYYTNNELIFSLLKIGKFALYVAAGMLTIRAIADNATWIKFNWSLLVSGLIVGINLIITRSKFVEILDLNLLIERAYQDNAISTLVAILILYLLGQKLVGFGTQRWQIAATFALVIMTLGTLLSDGRGGWVGAFVGLFYLLFRLHYRRTILAILFGLALIIIGYLYFPNFQNQVERTFWPDQAYLARYEAGIAGIDDGVRLTILRREGAKFTEDPILGRGFYHRGGLSGLMWWGSHNFFAQMFLETGIIGGFLILAIIWNMWRQAGSDIAQAANIDLPVKAAILTACVSGLSGEYFYGGTALLALLLVYGAAGRLPYVRQPAVQDQTVSTTINLSSRQITS